MTIPRARLLQALYAELNQLRCQRSYTPRRTKDYTDLCVKEKELLKFIIQVKEQTSLIVTVG